MNILKKYQDFKDEILSHPELNQHNKGSEHKWNEPKRLAGEEVMEMLLEDLELDFDIKLDESEQKYILFAGSSLVWHHTDNEFIYGGFKINGLWESLVLQSDFWKIDFSLAPDQKVPDDLKHFKKLNWFERQAWGDDERFGCFIREKGVFPPKIVFFDKNWYTEMDLSLEDYFEAMFATCAVKGWQYFYIDLDNNIPHLDKALEDMEKAVRLLPKIFPKRNFEYHRKQLIEIKTKLNK